MRDLLKALAEWLRADTARILNETRVHEAGEYMRGFLEGREDIMTTYGLEFTYTGPGEEDEEDE